MVNISHIFQLNVHLCQIFSWKIRLSYMRTFLSTRSYMRNNVFDIFQIKCVKYHVESINREWNATKIQIQCYVEMLLIPTSDFMRPVLFICVYTVNNVNILYTYQICIFLQYHRLLLLFLSVSLIPTNFISVDQTFIHHS